MASLTDTNAFQKSASKDYTTDSFSKNLNPSTLVKVNEEESPELLPSGFINGSSASVTSSILATGSLSPTKDALLLSDKYLKKEIGNSNDNITNVLQDSIPKSNIAVKLSSKITSPTSNSANDSVISSNSSARSPTTLANTMTNIHSLSTNPTGSTIRKNTASNDDNVTFHAHNEEEHIIELCPNNRYGKVTREFIVFNLI